MLLPRFNYHAPTSLAEAIEMMAQFKAKARVLAGGTDLLVNLKKRKDRAEEVISLGRLSDLKGLEVRAGGLKIGSLTTAAELATLRSDLVAISGLAEAAGVLGTPLVRNRATIGGNLVSARPAADLAPPLLCLEAKLTLAGPRGDRQVPLADFFKGPGQTIIEPEEILTEVVIPAFGPGCGGAYLKLAARRALEISIVGVAAFLCLDGQGTIKKARVFLAAVGPTPLRAASAEDLLLGERPKGEADPIFHGAGLRAAGEARPIDDFRASAEYRRHMTEVLTRRALAAAWLKARGSES